MASLQGSIKNTVDAALGESLTEIQAAIDSLTEASDNIATGDDVDNITDSLEDVEQDLSDLLASNNIFTGDLTINSEATLEFAQELKNKVRIVNGSVIIESNSEMDAIALQEVVDKIRTITKDLHIRAANSASPAITLDSLSGVGNIKIAQAGSISFASLISAKEIHFGNNYESNLKGVVNFGALKQVTGFKTGELGADFALTGVITNNAIKLEKVSQINLGSLPYYTPRNLELVADDDAEINLDALKTVDANGKERSYTISIKGAKEFEAPGITAGEVTVEDVETVVLASFKGDVVVEDGVENLTLGALAKDLSLVGKGDLISLDVTADAKDKEIDLTDASKLITAKIAGKIKTVLFTGNSDLETIDITAALEALTISNTAIEEATLDHTNSNLAEKASLVITNNEDLTILTADKIDGLATLTITGNDELENISFAALTKAPTKDGKAIVKIGGASDNNSLNASDITQESVDSKDGTFITDSGIDDLKDYLTAAAKSDSSELEVYFDTADDFTDGTTELTNLKITTPAHVEHLTVMNRDVSTGAEKSKRSFVIDDPGFVVNGPLSINGNDIDLVFTNKSTIGVVAELNAADTKAEAKIYGAALSVSAYGGPEARITFDAAPSTTVSISGVTSATTVAEAQSVSIQVNKKDSSDAEYTYTYYLSSEPISDLTPSRITADSNVYIDQFAITGANTNISHVFGELGREVFGFNNFNPYRAANLSVASATLELRAYDRSPARHGRGIKVTVSPALGWGNVTINRATTQDDTLLGTLPVLTLESVTAGKSILEGGLSEIGNPGDVEGNTAGTVSFTLLGSTVTELFDDPALDLPTDSPDYVNEGTEASSASDKIDRSSWF